MPPKTRQHLSDTAIPTGYASSNSTIANSGTNPSFVTTNEFQTVSVGTGQSLYSHQEQPVMTSSNLPNKRPKAQYNTSWARWI